MDSDEASFKFELGLLGYFQKTGWFDTEMQLMYAV